MSEVNLSAAEMARYARHITIPEFNVEGQKKLKAAKVLVIGAGGLGSPVLLYLAAAGIGHLGIVDFDVVDESNLQRQVLYTVEDIGKSKAENAKKRLLALNPHLEVTIHNVRITSDNAREIISQYDVVADGTDNFQTRYLVNDACVLENKTNVYASIFRFEGQVSVFNYLNEDGERGPNYRDMFPEPPPPGLVPNCAEGGVIGVLPGIIGSMQALEVIKVVSGVGTPLAGRLFLLDAATFETRTLKVYKNPNTKIEGLIDYDLFCGIHPVKEDEANKVKEVSVQELKGFIDQKNDIKLIDVREPFEYEIANLNAELIPLSSVLDAAERFKHSDKVIVHCKSGARSAKAIKLLQEELELDNLYNLKGGILAYAREIDTSLQTY